MTIERRSLVTRAATRLLVFSRCPLIRSGMRLALEDHSWVGEVVEVDSLADLGRWCAEPGESLALIDLSRSSSTATALRVLSRLRPSNPRLRVMVVVGTAGRDEVNALLAMGIAGILDIDSALSDFASAVTEVLGGRGYYGIARREQADGELISELKGLDSELSCREREVLHELALGATNRAIGKKLDIAEATVKFHLRSLQRKLHVRGRTSIVYHAMNRGIL